MFLAVILLVILLDPCTKDWVNTDRYRFTSASPLICSVELPSCGDPKSVRRFSVVSVGSVTVLWTLPYDTLRFYIVVLVGSGPENCKIYLSQDGLKQI